jgi:hypothetical protein
MEMCQDVDWIQLNQDGDKHVSCKVFTNEGKYPKHSNFMTLSKVGGALIKNRAGFPIAIRYSSQRSKLKHTYFHFMQMREHYTIQN